MRYLSVCSGIEAASVAWKPLGMEAILLSEIETFPRAVLKARQGAQDISKSGYTPDKGPALWGDFTALRPLHFRRFGLPFPDIIVGGPPCQAFSIAGARRSLADARGNLTLSFVRFIHAFRNAGPLRYALYENVPGILSTKDNAFGCLLAGLVGADAPLRSPLERGRWPNAGMVAGPLGRTAWRILDAQYWGLAQRRKRVFVVTGFGDESDPAAVLFERKSLQGHSRPRRQSWENVAPTIASRPTGGGGLGTDFDLDGGLIAHSLRPEGYDASEDGTGRGTPIVPVAYAIQERAVSENPENGPQGSGISEGLAYTLEARNKVQAIAFALRGREGGDGQTIGALKSGGGKPGQSYPCIAFGGNNTSGSIEVAAALNAKGGSGRCDFETETLIAFSSKDHGADAQNDIAPTLRAMGHSGSHANAGGQVADSNLTGVRRITPNEAEALQGFPCGYTLIKMNRIVRSKVDKDMAEYYRRTHQDQGFEDMTDDDLRRLAADGPRYKALGNSFAVPVMAYLGKRIAKVDAILAASTASHTAEEENPSPVRVDGQTAVSGRI